MQLLFGIFTMRCKFGYHLFEYLGQLIETFINFTDYGSQLVFGDSFRDHYFAFKVRSMFKKTTIKTNCKRIANATTI